VSSGFAYGPERHQQNSRKETETQALIPSGKQATSTRDLQFRIQLRIRETVNSLAS
jgi:hypothetical protein